MEETSYEKAKRVAEGLKKQSEERKIEDAKELAQVVSSLTAISQNEELAAMYRESASMGTDNLSGDMPILKIHTTGRSTNELADGSEPQNGWFYYKPTRQEFNSIDCHILSISRGFTTDKIGKPGETTYNHLLSGVMKIDGEYAPFIIYLNSAGHRNKMYAFGKQIHQYTHQRPLPIPMFALTVKLFTVQDKYEFTTGDGKKMSGKSWVLEYEVQKNEDGSPVLVGDPKEFMFLKESVAKAEEIMEGIIKNRSNEETVTRRAAGISEEKAVEYIPSGSDEDLPF